jgi:DNA-binding transcriptional ArsR family regulator
MSSNQLNAALRHAAPVFSALGDDVRLHIVARLGKGEPLSITRLTEGVPITRQAVTKHLHVLEKARLVKGSRSGRERTWVLKPEPIDEARRCLDAISNQWGGALNRLKTFVEETSS